MDKNNLIERLEKYTKEHPNADDYAKKMEQLAKEKEKGTVKYLEKKLDKYKKFLESGVDNANKKAALNNAKSKFDDAITIWTKEDRKELLKSIAGFWGHPKKNIPRIADSISEFAKNKDVRKQAYKEVNEALADKRYDTYMKIGYNAANETISKQTVKPWIDNKVEKNKDK